MANWNTIQNKFTSGILSQRYAGQVNSQSVREGLQLAENAFVFPQGPVAKRPGTQFLDYIVANENFNLNNCRVWRFIGPDNNDLVAVFYQDTVSVFNATTGIIGGSTAIFTQLLSNTTFTSESMLDNWVGQAGNPASAYRLLFYWALFGGAGSARLRQEAEISFFLNGQPADFLPEQTMFQTKVVNPGLDEFRVSCRCLISETMKSDTNGSVDALYFEVRLELYAGASVVASQTFSIDPDVESVFVLDYVNPGVLASNQVSAQVVIVPLINPGEVQPGQAIKAGTFFELIVREMTMSARFTPPGGSEITFTTPYDNDTVNDLHFVQSPYDNRELIVLHPNFYPRALSESGGAWSFANYPFAADPPEWAPGNYPGVGCAHHGRLVLTGVPSYPELLRASESGVWTNIYNASPSNKGDALFLVAQERDINTWVLSLKGLLYGDKRAEREIFAASENFIAFDDIAIRNQSSFGSLRMPQKILFGKHIVLATGGKSDLRLIQYSRENGGFIAPNIIGQAEHLGRAGFKTHFFTRKPHLILWNIMDDGTIMLCHFDDQMEINAWTRLPRPVNARYLDGCAVTDENGIDVVFLVSERIEGIGPNGIFTFEFIDNLADYNEWRFYDTSMTVVNPGVTGLLSGFELFALQEVSVFYDGEYDGNQFVTELGQINVTDTTSNLISVGQPYNFQVTTFPQASAEVQSGLTAKKRYSKLGVRGLFSSPPVINGQRPPDRDPNNFMNQSINPQTVLDTAIVDLDFSETAEITIEERSPWGVMIAAIFGKLTSNQL